MSATIILPNTNESHIAHILAKDKYAFKYISKDYILAEIGSLCDAAQKANANIRPIVGLDSKNKAGLLDTYEDLYRECREYNLALLSDKQDRLHQPVVKMPLERHAYAMRRKGSYVTVMSLPSVKQET